MKPIKKTNKNLKKNKPNEDTRYNAKETIDLLNKERNIVKKFNKLKKLIHSNGPNLVRDSFKSNPNIQSTQEQTFNTEGFNIVIIGAGVTG